ncbi:uncharacterized protein LOC106153781 [Lingula anatina]|uniref:Uncharacterized protein LOC106153781 n=1 Tax=Lingula anatina TaxID=7574 RepID=A0A1S3HBE2_LINAN|nr:uncharacterized protein LOC106153781 [Lingula anatina]|eukprot:XP_013383335.1 uncharacterized protein LOC106153781 [Lingula anatina]
MMNVYLLLSALLCGVYFELVTGTDAPWPTPTPKPTTPPFWWYCRFPDATKPFEHCRSGRCSGSGLRCVNIHSVVTRLPIETKTPTGPTRTPPTRTPPTRSTTPWTTKLYGYTSTPLPLFRAKRCTLSTSFPLWYRCVPVEYIIG